MTSLGCGRERRRLRAEQGLDGTSNDLVLAQCALRPGVVEDADCEKADDGRSIKGSQKHMKIVCTEVVTDLYSSYKIGCSQIYNVCELPDYVL